MDCLFCKIARKEIQAKIVYEDTLVVAFEDVNPQAPVHILIIPHKHIATSLELTADDAALTGHMIAVANKIAQDKAIAQSGFRMVMNCNRDAGQSVFHIHLHLLGGRPMSWPPG
ncbi:histidine triad nucleotide-binding protein [Candidatus Magnetomonas plexicatena]|uniref:histidine triad nucleotide-binding protein n=1 Tax=Candidatus Magnetomonas plexicatena TaxID=2552947 RepID=UPI0011018B62|nr:histidine triad nucleotide-binding protein [Nitrospirales bacterium LBB_01]